MNIPVQYYPVAPVTDPNSGYPGFHPHVEVYPQGYQAQPGRLAFACDTVCQQDVAIRLRDGTTIYADIYRPVGDEKVPAILAWGVAGKRGRNLAQGQGAAGGPPVKLALASSQAGLPGIDMTSGLQAWNGPDPAVWVQYGYAIVNADPRGIFASEGDIQYFGSQDARDGYDCIEWIGVQDWCNGSVGMSGSHWYGIEQWFIAAAQPPHLRAIAPGECHGNLYVDEFVRDGIPRLDFSARTRSYSTHACQIEDICAMAERYPLMNEYWEDKAADFSKISIPAYVTASWTQTNHSRGVFEGFNAIATQDKWLRVHDIGEFYDPRLPENVLDKKRFFDRYLKGEDNGWEATPTVRLSTLDPGGVNETNRPEASFPLARQQVRTVYLTAEGGLSDTKPEAPATLAYAADDSRSTANFTLGFEEDTEITGFLGLKLWLEAEAEDADVFVRVFKLNAAGEKLYSVTGNRYSGPNGRLRASHRKLDEQASTPLQPVHVHRAEELLTPGQVVPLEIGIWPTSLRFHPGEQLLLEISGFEVKVAHMGDDLIPTRNRGRHILHLGGDYDARLLLPVIPAKEEP